MRLRCAYGRVGGGVGNRFAETSDHERERLRSNNGNQNTQPRPRDSLPLLFRHIIIRRGSTAVAAAPPAAPTTAPRASTSAKSESESSESRRRTLLSSLAGAAAFAAFAQLSSPQALLPRAAAAIGVWDGSSAASGSCAVGPDGDACRARTLAKDFGKGSSSEEGYGTSIKASSKIATNTNSIPIPSVQGGAYAAETRALAASIREYVALAPTDASRVPKGKELRKAGAVWAAKYAPGGSARLKSARCVLFFCFGVLCLTFFSFIYSFSCPLTSLRKGRAGGFEEGGRSATRGKGRKRRAEKQTFF